MTFYNSRKCQPRLSRNQIPFHIAQTVRAGFNYKPQAIRPETHQYSTVQYSTVQYSTVQYSTVQYSTVQYSTVQYSTVQYSTVQYSRCQDHISAVPTAYITSARSLIST